MPAIADISGDITNLVDDTTTTANSDTHSRPAALPLPTGHRPLNPLRPPTNDSSARPLTSADPAE